VDVWLTPLWQGRRELLPDLCTVLEQGPYDVIHFNIGAHGWPKGRIPEGQYEPLMRQYVETIQSHAGHARLIWANITPATIPGRPTVLRPEVNSILMEHNAMAAKIMNSHGILIDDLYGLMIDKLAFGKGDGGHWNPKGTAVQAAQVTAFILKALPPLSGKANQRKIVAPSGTPTGKTRLDAAPADSHWHAPRLALRLVPAGDTIASFYREIT
jgi:hypothetical protein